jgi:hypothetical protein
MVQSDLARRLRDRSEIPLRLSGGPRGSRVWPGRRTSASTRAESCIAAVLLGVVELWLSQGRPKTARTGVWGFGRTDLRAPARRSPSTYTGARRRRHCATVPSNKTSVSVC